MDSRTQGKSSLIKQRMQGQMQHKVYMSFFKRCVFILLPFLFCNLSGVILYPFLIMLHKQTFRRPGRLSHLPPPPPPLPHPLHFHVTLIKIRISTLAPSRSNSSNSPSIRTASTKEQPMRVSSHVLDTFK